LKKLTSAILEFFFRLLLRRYRSNRRAILHQATTCHANRTTRGRVMTSCNLHFQDGGCSGSILYTSDFVLNVNLTGGQNLSANQISSRYLNPQLRYSYFRFGKTNVRYIGFLLPVSILTTSPNSTCHSALGCRISSQSVHRERRYDVISIFKMAATVAQFYFRFQIRVTSLFLGCHFLSANQIS